MDLFPFSLFFCNIQGWSVLNILLSLQQSQTVVQLFNFSNHIQVSQVKEFVGS